MHVRFVKLRSGNRGVQLAESYRVGTKVRKRIVRRIGTAATGKELEHMRSASRGNIFPDTTLAGMAVRARQLHQLKNKGRK